MNGTRLGVVISINFKKLHTEICSGNWEPNAPDSDYEYWIPTNYKGDKCVFGQKIKYIRRKRESKCFNPQEFDKKLITESCPCTEEDWECDYGFERKQENGPCVPMNSEYGIPYTPVPPKDCYGTFEAKTGYKKLGGVFCEGGVNHSGT